MTDGRPGWACPDFEWPEHDWLNCLECLNGYQRFLGRSPSDEHIIVWPEDDKPDTNMGV